MAITLDQLIEWKNIPQSLALYGESHYHIDLYYKKLVTVIKADETIIFHNFDYNFESVRDTLLSESLFAESTLVVIKSGDKIKSTDLVNLSKIADKVKTNKLIYIFYGYEKEVKEVFGDRAFRFFQPREGELISILKQEISSRKLIFDKESIDELIIRTGGNLSIAINELHKLSLSDKKQFYKQDIIQSVSLVAELETDEVLSKFIEQNNLNIIIDYVSLNNIDYLEIFIYLNKFIWDIYLFKSAILSSNNLNSLSILGKRLPPQVEKLLIKMAHKLSIKQISNILIISMKFESLIKSGKFGNKESLAIASLSQIEKVLVS